MRTVSGIALHLRGGTVPAANVGTTSVVGERGGESGSGHQMKEGRRHEGTCHSPGDAQSTHVVELQTKGAEEGRENADVGQSYDDDHMKAQTIACEEEVLEPVVTATEDVNEGEATPPEREAYGAQLPDVCTEEVRSSKVEEQMRASEMGAPNAKERECKLMMKLSWG